MASLQLRRVTRPGPQELEALAGYDGEVFGPAALNTYELAVVAEAGALYLGEAEGEVIGCCQLLRRLSEPETLWVLGFYIRPGYQGRGLGRALLEMVRDELPGLGARGLALTVAPDNERAKRLYAGCGFKVVEEVEDFYGRGEDRHLLRYERSAP